MASAPVSASAFLGKWEKTFDSFEESRRAHGLPLPQSPSGAKSTMEFTETGGPGRGQMSIKTVVESRGVTEVWNFELGKEQLQPSPQPNDPNAMMKYIFYMEGSKLVHKLTNAAGTLGGLGPKELLTTFEVNENGNELVINHVAGAQVVVRKLKKIA